VNHNMKSQNLLKLRLKNINTFNKITFEIS
jgi:hypothetical protein